MFDVGESEKNLEMQLSEALAFWDISKFTPGFLNLVSGYLAYSEENICRRYLPFLGDGLKPGARRVITMLHDRFGKHEKVKCADLVGATLKLHPHAKEAVYVSLVLMTDRNGSMELPLLKGQGNFGNVSTTDPPAADRYTEVMMHEEAEEYLKDWDGATMVANYDSTTTEPKELPVTYPAVLCNAQKGISVGLRVMIPSFNFSEVIDLTLEYLREGECKTVICPDFVTGGYYIRNNKELRKLMQTGKCKLKLRGRVEKVGSDLIISELPYGVKVDTILRQIGDAEIQGVQHYGETSDYDNGTQVTVNCTKRKVDEVLLALYKKTALQSNLSVTMAFVVDGKPENLGVWGVIEKWVAWRRKVIEKRLTVEIARLQQEMQESRAFITLWQDKDKLYHMADLVLHRPEEEAVQYLLDNFDNEIITEDLAKWLITRRMNEYRTGERYIKRYEQLKKRLEKAKSDLQDIDGTMIRELEELKERKGPQHPRKTEVTNTDYEFVADEEGEIIHDTTKVWYTFKDGFLRKSKVQPEGDYQFQFQGIACDTLVAVDNRGRLLRVYCEDLPYTSGDELGTYLPKYFELSETSDYLITWIGVLDGSEKMLLYRDGNVGFLDTSEWVGTNRRVRVLENGISYAAAPLLGAVIDVPEWLFVLDTDNRLGCVNLVNVKHKSRTAKTRVFQPAKNKEIYAYLPLTVDEGMNCLDDIERHYAPKLKHLLTEDSFRKGAYSFTLMF